ncbi:MAG: hypothetical protein Kow00124_02540 [Anaerolineae bacterium]
MEFRYRYGDQEYVIRLELGPEGSYLAYVGDRVHRFEIDRSGDGQFNLCFGGRRVHAYTARMRSPQTGEAHHYVALVDREVTTFDLVLLTGSTTRRAGGGAGGGDLVAQMPGQVIEVGAAPGDAVRAGQTLLVLEAMKMEIRVTAPFDGVLMRLHVQAGDTVDRGQLLAEVVPAAEDAIPS